MSSDAWETIRFCAPSVVTIGALLSGLSAIRFAADAEFHSSVLCTLLACVLDGLDGHVARYLNACTKIGFELDSLCDLANFGVAPPLIVYFWAKALPVDECRSENCSYDHAWIWCSCCVYAACCAFRLARFNVSGHEAEMNQQHLPAKPKKPPVAQAWKHNVLSRKLYFRGVPAPVGAAYALIPMMLRLSFLTSWIGNVGEVGAWAIGRRGTACTLIATGVLMVSTVPTLSSKMLKTTGEDTHLSSRGPLMFTAKAVAMMLASCIAWKFPIEIFLLMCIGHLLSIPVGWLIYYNFATDFSRQKS